MSASFQAGDKRPLERLKTLGPGKPAPEAVARLYAQAFAEFGVSALWRRRASELPTVKQALTVADALRYEGDLRAQKLAVDIEAACRAAL